MITVTVKSRLSNTRGVSKKVEIREDDTAEDLIRNICLLLGTDADHRMFIRSSEKRSAILFGGVALNDVLSDGETVTLETRKVRKSQWFLAGFCIFTGVVLISVGSALFAVKRVESETALGNATGFAAVVDAGSSHTSVFLYELTWMIEYETAFQRQLNECYIDGGVADLTGSSYEEIEAYIGPCLDETYGLVNGSRTPIALGATAGMRLLRYEDPGAAERLMQDLRKILSTSGFILVEDEDARILTGEEEGGFAWISINVLTDRLVPPSNGDDGVFGSLDMGGASNQFAQLPSSSSSSNMAARDTVTYRLYNRTYEIQSDSLMCYGLKEIVKRYSALLVYEDYLNDDTRNETEIVNPCINSFYNDDDEGGLVAKTDEEEEGYRKRMSRSDWIPTFPTTKEDIFSSVCTEMKDDDFNAYLNTLEGDFEFYQSADYNEAECQLFLDVFVDKSDCDAVFAEGECLNPVDYPETPVEPRFFAMASYYYSLALPIHWTDGMTQNEAMANLELLCVSEQQTCQDCSETDCFLAKIIYTVLTKGFHFVDDEFLKLNFVNDVGGQSVEWPLGYVIDWSSNMRSTKPDFEAESTERYASIISPAVFAVLIGFGGVFLLGGIAAIIALHKRNK